MASSAKPRKKVAAKGHKLPEPIPEGFELTDSIKRGWRTGKEIGSGGFGTVYLGSEAGKKDFDYVIKVEYKDNGPLFAEMHCYQNIGKPAQLTEWVKKKKLQYLGLSPCYGFGSFEYRGSKYRFMVIERFGRDLQKIFEENGQRFPPKATYLIGMSLLNVLEYVHSTGYIHGDIKAANLLLGRKKGSEDQVYLVDMGLACKFLREGAHKKEAPDPKKAHNGTPEFTSRDAHRGCFSRRSDLEILCYNMLQWLSGELPWERFIKDNNKLQKEKEKSMENIDDFLDQLFGNENCPEGMRKFLRYVADMTFEQEPDYNLCRKYLKEELKRIGCGSDTTLDFKAAPKKKPPSSAKIGDAAAKEEDKSKPKKPLQEKRKPANNEVNLEPGVVPTPAMLELMNKKAGTKPPKTRRRN